MTTIITDVGRSLTWEEALAYSQQYGGVLTKTLYHAYGSHRFESYAWIGAHKVGDDWVWMDGSPVEQTDGDYYSGSVDPIFTDDDPSNDPAHALLIGYSLRDDDLGSDEIVSKFIWEKQGLTITGTPYADWVWGEVVGKTLNLGAGDDWIFDDSDREGAKFEANMGAGRDIVSVNGVTYARVSDGAGADQIGIYNGLVKAALDGENDVYSVLNGTVSYDTAKQSITGINYGVVSGAEIGSDQVEAVQIIGGSGDDTLSGFERITGGRGNDTLQATVYATGGDGNDTLIADSWQKVTLLGDGGADTFIIRSIAEVTGGAGVDNYVFETVAKTTINGLQAGEIIDLSALLDVSVPDAFAGGYLKQTVLKGYTYLSIDLDGGGNDYQDLATVKGVFGLADYIVA